MDGLSALRTLLASKQSLNLHNQYSHENSPKILNSYETSDSHAIDFSLPNCKKFKNPRQSVSISRGTLPARDANILRVLRDENPSNEHQSGGVVVINKKKAAFDLWHKRKLSEIDKKCSWTKKETGRVPKKRARFSADVQNFVEWSQTGHWDQNDSRNIGNECHENFCENRRDIVCTDDLEKFVIKPGSATGVFLGPTSQPGKSGEISLVKNYANFLSNSQNLALIHAQGGLPHHMNLKEASKAENFYSSDWNLMGHKKSTKRVVQQQSFRQHSQDIVSPKLSRHNDAAFYPNIQCILCKEWVCSRNRYMHIESHLQYRPYKCSVCHYDNRKKIFIELHIKKAHRAQQGVVVVYSPDNELEKRAWALAEQCLQHTREVLLKKGDPSDPVEKPCVDSTSVQSTTSNQQSTHNQLTSSNTVADSLLANYGEVFRPSIYNSQRRGKSLLIEKSRQLGLVPDFSQVLQREEKCHLCAAHVLRTHNLLEEHVRAHLSRPSYACSFDQCTVTHNSRNFIYRHMKEVHRSRKPTRDLLFDFQNINPTGTNFSSNEIDLKTEFQNLCRSCFPFYFADKDANFTNQRRRTGSVTSPPHSHAIDLSAPKSLKMLNTSKIDSSSGGQRLTLPHAADTTCYGCELGLSLKWSVVTSQMDGKELENDLLSDSHENRECIECSIALNEQRHSHANLFTGRLFCLLCVRFVSGDLPSAQWHAYRHCWPAPFACPMCDFTSHSVRTVRDHIHATADHSSTIVSSETSSLTDKHLIRFQWAHSDWLNVWANTFAQCFVATDGQSVPRDDEGARLMVKVEKIEESAANSEIAVEERAFFVDATAGGAIEDGADEKWPEEGARAATVVATLRGDVNIRQTCALCSTLVVGDYRVLLDHTSRHMNRQSYSCLYCGNEPGNKTVESTKELSVKVHVAQSHTHMPPVVRMDTTKEAMDERNLLLLLCFPSLEPKTWLQKSIDEAT